MTTGQQKNIRVWEDKNCFGAIAYLDYRPNEVHHYIFFDGDNMRFVSRTCLVGISEELRRFYGEGETNN